jgi:hypothetical protein
MLYASLPATKISAPSLNASLEAYEHLTMCCDQRSQQAENGEKRKKNTHRACNYNR